MLKLIETIRFEEGRFINLDYHQQRMNRSRKILFGLDVEIDLEDYFLNNRFASSSGFQIRMSIKSSQVEPGLFKCRIIYSKIIEKTEFLPYHIPKIKKLRLIADDNIEYAHKYLNRKAIEKLLERKDGCDDILMVKNGLITDTSFTNILFYNGKNWITPEKPLLKGTQRGKLLHDEKIKTADIRVGDLNNFTKARLINAMIRFEDEVDIIIEKIKFP